MKSMASSERLPSAGSAELVLQNILDSTRECVLVVSQNLRITNYNVPAAVSFGREGLDLEGRRLSEVLRNIELHGAFQRALTEQVSSDIQFELIRTGTRKFDVHIAPIELNGQHFAIGFFYETTQIERLESIRQEFLSNISHELRTPLTSILAFVETLEDGGLDDAENNRQFLGVIRRNAERMRCLISDILDLSMIESGNVPVDLCPVHLLPVVEDIFAALSAKAKVRDVTLHADIEPGVTLIADPGRLEQMLINLIDNAVKFNRDGGEVEVVFERRPDKDVISVSDTGEGILPEHAPRIFERFFRADRSRSGESRGTGLGLAIVKHLTKLHGGEISMRSEMGVGTTFTIELPSEKRP